MREQINTIEEDKEWLVNIVLLRIVFAIKLAKREEM